MGIPKDGPLIVTSMYKGISEIVRHDIDPARVVRLIAGTTIKTRDELVHRVVGGHDIIMHQKDMKKLKGRFRHRAAAVAISLWDRGVIEQPNLNHTPSTGSYVLAYNGMPQTIYGVEDFPRVNDRFQIIHDEFLPLLPYPE